ncbi:MULTISPECIES: IclR family transcriptional regulator [Micromonospora]|uniref:IclR family transcriptional regulator n=1 Tax=Micromonospora sicca TaxID=2202420 RepID=A0A317DGR6_9ACTN|nr:MULTISPECIES: IclR family transcriptional regulator [unclassified Micromonospora]MBM0224304.1 IclR family transcriptional regulator [Micromonospora sp. ATA51]PWR13891.1 IclR family transcriptional regulator [Micromonospora sp. 4G51]
MPPVNVLSKADRVLELLADQGEMPIAGLIEALEEPRTSVYRLLESMQELGWVEPGARRGQYRLGLKVFRLGAAVAQRFDERQAALPVMERLHEQTGETVFLCVRQGLEAVCIERIDGARVQILELRLGGRLPLHVGGAPRVLLAFAGEALWDEYLFRSPLTTYTSKTLNTPELVRQSLAADVNAGIVISDEDVTPGIASIAAPVFNHTGTVCAALSLAGVSPVLLGDNRQRHESMVREAAAEVSRSLGYSS